jgi:hypothetical protein
MFAYEERQTCTINVQPIRRTRTLSLSTRELTEPGEGELGPITSYKIHMGYYRVLMGFLREIEFMTKDKLKSHNCLFRATYLSKVLDYFVEELPRIPKKTPERFRSQALNPLLQRQLNGVLDHEAKMVKAEVGESRKEALSFYLLEDPLHPDHCDFLRRNLLYVWPVRLSLGFILTSNPCTENSFKSALNNTKELLTSRAQISDEEWAAGVIMRSELRMVQLEGLESFFSDFLEDDESRGDKPHDDEPAEPGVSILLSSYQPTLSLTSSISLLSRTGNQRKTDRLSGCWLLPEESTPWTRRSKVPKSLRQMSTFLFFVLKFSPSHLHLLHCITTMASSKYTVFSNNMGFGIIRENNWCSIMVQMTLIMLCDAPPSYQEVCWTFSEIANWAKWSTAPSPFPTMYAAPQRRPVPYP